MSSRRSMTVEEGHENALIALPSQGALANRNAGLAVVPPRPLPLVYKARRSFVKLTVWGSLAAVCAFSGYAYRDPDIRRAVDYRLTMLTTPGISKVVATHHTSRPGPEPLPAYARYLFVENQKGPRADRFSMARKMGGTDSIVRRTKDQPAAFQCRIRSGRYGGGRAALSDGVYAPQRTGVPKYSRSHCVRAATAPAPAQQNDGSGEWASLLKNASLSPDAAEDAVRRAHGGPIPHARDCAAWPLRSISKPATSRSKARSPSRRSS